MQKARRHTVRIHRAPTACKHMVSGSFPPLKGVLFIVRSLYSPLSVISEYLALRDGPRWFSQGFTWLDLLRILLEVKQFRLRDSHPLWFHRSKWIPLSFYLITPIEVLLPQPENPVGLGSFAFARRYLQNRFFFLFLRLLRCFSSPRSPYKPICSVYICSGIPGSTLV